MVSLKSYQADEIALAVYEACARKVAAEPRRGYLGMSQIGKPCERALWLDINQAERSPVEGRVARVFHNGHTREDIIIADLEAAGYKVDGRQGEFSDFGGKFSGHRDGVVHGITKMPHLLEIKTTNDANFKAFVKNGVKQKPEYLAQMQCYMGYGGQERGLFVVENKNTQELYTERVYFDPKAFSDLKAKARRIIEAPAAPEKINDESECYWCPFKYSGCLNPPVTTVPESGCRACEHFRPVESSAGAMTNIVTTLRHIVSFLKDMPPVEQEKQRALAYELLKKAMSYRPDVLIPMEIHCRYTASLSEKFFSFLEYILTGQNPWCTGAYTDTRDPMKTWYKSLPAAHHWCAHPRHKAAVYRLEARCEDNTVVN